MKAVRDFGARLRMALSSRLLPLAVRLRSPWLTALVFAGLMRRMSGKRRFRVLAISKDVFEQDLRALSTYGHDIEYCSIAISSLRRIMIGCFGEGRESLRGDTYHETDDWAEGRQRYYEFLMRMLANLRTLIRIDGVIGCNFGNVTLLEFSRAVRDSGLPYICYFKEGIPIPERIDEYCELFEPCYMPKRIEADCILVNSGTGSEVFSRMSLPGLNAGKVHAVGAPRLDAYRVANPSPPATPLLAVFTFDPVGSLFYFRELWAEDPRYQLRFGATGGLDLSRDLRARTVEIYAEIVAFARRHPEVEVVFKSKGDSISRGLIRETLERILGGPIETRAPQNLKVRSDWVASDLILRASAVVSFNSMTTVEAVLARKPVLVPDMGPHFPGRPWSFFHDFPGLSHLVSNEDDIETAFRAGATTDEGYEEAREAFLRRYTAVGGCELSTTAAEDVLRGVIAGEEPAADWLASSTKAALSGNPD